MTCRPHLVQQSAADPQFLNPVLFNDEATFSREGLNTQNVHMLGIDNPHKIQPRSAQQRFTVNVRVDIVVDSSVGPYILLSQLYPRNYLLFLPETLNNVSAHVDADCSFNMMERNRDYVQDVSETFPLTDNNGLS